VVFIARHQSTLEKLGLATVPQVKAFQGKLIKDHKGRRDILRVAATDGDGRDLVLFLKRTWKPYRKDGLASLLRGGQVWSISRRVWDNSKRLLAAGITTGALVAYGEDCGSLWERFSFLLTETASGQQTVQQFLRECRERAERRRVFDALARLVRQMHDAGLATPDLFTRHIFVDARLEPPRFCLIDMARLDLKSTTSRRQRARDLAALNITAPLRYVTARERVRFLNIYTGGQNRRLFRLIRRRMNHLLPRGRFRDFQRPVNL
jgi:tRNA A-37 threonylcarbamoyl transferase component Bud32